MSDKHLFSVGLDYIFTDIKDVCFLVFQICFGVEKKSYHPFVLDRDGHDSRSAFSFEESIHPDFLMVILEELILQFFRGTSPRALVSYTVFLGARSERLNQCFPRQIR